MGKRSLDYYYVYELHHLGETIYIGSTKMTLSDRLTAHKRDARNGMNKLVSQKIRELGGISIRAYEPKYDSKLDARIAEQSAIEKHEHLYNSIAAYRENHEYYRNHGDNISHTKKLISRKKQYAKMKQDPVKLDKSRLRQKEKMRKLRANMSEEKKKEIRAIEAARARYKRECKRLLTIEYE